MTFEEAKKILEKEGCFIITKLYGSIDYVKFQPWEKANVKEAIAFLGKNGYRVQMEVYTASERNARLIEEYNMRKKADEPIDKTRLKESEKQFNDALLDEQAKKIKELVAQNKKLNDIIASRNNEIWELQEKVKKMAKLGKQIAHLNEVIGKKNAQLKDYKIACEEHDEQLKDYMLSDKNKDDMISGLKKVNEGLRHQLANATISKVNEQALKSAESALVYKDKVIDRLKKTISDAVDILEKKDDRVYNIDPESVTDDWFTEAALRFFHITK